MNQPFEESQRKSQLNYGEIYFWTATINQWQHLLLHNSFKDVILQSINNLSERGKVDVFSFVIMPNHIHLIWRLNEKNGKESPHASFLKFTAHEFKKMLIAQGEEKLMSYLVDAKNKEYEFWKRDSLATILFTREVAYQKMDYIHRNPCAGKWQLVADYCDYSYSSAAYYEKGIKSFAFLKDLREEF